MNSRGSTAPRWWLRAVERSLEIAQRIAFDLGQLKYEYPDEPVPPGSTAIQHLTRLAWDGAKWRYPDGVPEKVRKLLREELALIKKKKSYMVPGTTDSGRVQLLVGGAA